MDRKTCAGLKQSGALVCCILEFNLCPRPSLSLPTPHHPHQSQCCLHLVGVSCNSHSLGPSGSPCLSLPSETPYFFVLASDSVSLGLSWTGPNSHPLYLTGRVPPCRQCSGSVPRLEQVTAAVDLSIAPLPFNCSQLQTRAGAWIIQAPPTSLAEIDPRGPGMSEAHGGHVMISCKYLPLFGPPCSTCSSRLWGFSAQRLCEERTSS